MSDVPDFSVFGALVILSPDKRDVLVVPQDNTLYRKVSLRFPGTTVETQQAVSPYLLALVERVVDVQGNTEERVLRAKHLFRCGMVSVETQNWGSDVNSLIRDEFEPHAKSFLCYVMTNDFDWDLVRKKPIPKRSEFFTNLLEPRMVPLADVANPPEKYTAPRAHRSVATKLLTILQERVCSN